MGFLIESLTYREKALVEHAEELLTPALATLEELPSAQSRQLSLRIVLTQNFGFAEAALKVLGKAGDASCLDGLISFSERLAGKRRRGQFDKCRTLAHEALGNIRFRTAQELMQADIRQQSAIPSAPEPPLAKRVQPLS